MPPINDLGTILAQLRPILNPGRYAFVTLPDNHAVAPSTILASIREPEGLSAILNEQDAVKLGLPTAFIAAWITLTVSSDLSAVGLTAAFATALTHAGISCNVVAGTHHDHLFVPVNQAEQAMEVLRRLQKPE